MKALFLGGTGMISSAVSKEAIEKGWDITILNRGNHLEGMAKGAKLIKCDINDIKKVEKLIENLYFDVIIDFFAFTLEDIERDYEIFKNKTDQFIFISTAAVYDKSMTRCMVTESTAASNIGWGYSKNKILCENFLMDKYRYEGLPLTIVRPSQIYNESFIPVAVGGDGGFKSTIARMISGKKVIIHGDGTAIWTLTFASDFAKGIVPLMGNMHSIGEVYHITSDENLTWNQIMTTLAKALKCDANFVYVSSESLIKMNPSLEGPLRHDSNHCNIFDNTKIKEAVPGFNAKIRYEQGVRIALKNLSDKESFESNSDFDEWCDKVIEKFDL